METFFFSYILTKDLIFPPTLRQNIDPLSPGLESVIRVIWVRDVGACHEMELRANNSA